MSESVPKDEQETVITRYRVEKRYRVSTTDTTEITRLRRAGYHPAEDPAAEPYLVFEVPFEAIPPYRSAKTIQTLQARAQRLRKRSTVAGSPGTGGTIATLPGQRQAPSKQRDLQGQNRFTVQGRQYDQGGAR
jgi:hypothetical protein